MFSPKTFRIGLHFGNIGTALELIKHFEGCRLKEYTAYGKTAIGYGRDVYAGSYPAGITQQQADDFLETDLTYFFRQVWHALGDKATFPALNAYTSFAYNVGLGQHKPFVEGFLTSTTLREFLNGDIAAAGKSLLLWNKVGTEVVVGLETRRRCEASILAGNNLNYLATNNWLAQ